TPIPHAFESPRMIRCLFDIDPEIAGNDFAGCIDLIPLEEDREITDRDRRVLGFLCRQAGNVLAHQWIFQKLSRTQDRLESALNAVGEVSAFVGHEIRSPLASLHSLAFLIQDQVQEMSARDGASPEDWEQLLEKMKQSSALLSKVVRSTYLLGTLDMDESTFQRDLEWVEMGRSLLDSAESVYLYEICRKNLCVVVRRETRFSHDFVHVHRVWFEAIFDNLLGNAIKYTARGGSIDFSILEDQTEYTIHVSNPVEKPPSPERLNRLFEKGYRGLESGFDHRSIGANQGLGLYFVNKIVTEGYGGKVHVWVSRERNRDGTERAGRIETRVFDQTRPDQEEGTAPYFHIGIRIPRNALQGMF
ncbi:MAG: GHKL domain-containing protein, partial [Candidatus Omnitrophica bacterium]|nr:GHKL domain-containing protein [Candidatus Omnitrophota bacterium]